MLTYNTYMHLYKVPLSTYRRCPHLPIGGATFTYRKWLPPCIGDAILNYRRCLHPPKLEEVPTYKRFPDPPVEVLIQSSPKMSYLVTKVWFLFLFLTFQPHTQHFRSQQILWTITSLLHVSEGKFKSFGLSNYSAWQVVSVLIQLKVF